MESTCSLCRRHYCDLLSEKKELFLTDCGHVFDSICIKKITDTSQCTCGKTIKKIEQICPNIWGECAYDSEMHATLPGSLSDSLDAGMQILITNCGHLVHAACWIEFRELEKEEYKWGKCPVCSQKITHLVPFKIIPMLYAVWKIQDEKENTRQTEHILKEFVENNAPKEKSIPKTASLLNMDGFEML
jgi:DNA-directed RNA polymerase subunit RPC12/RpoP